MDGPGARWSFLRAWCAPLRSLSPVVDRRGVRLHLSPAACGPAPPERLLRLREAALLLALLARVDFWAWTHVLRAHCGVSVDAQFVDSEVVRSARAVFVVDATGDDFGGLELLLCGEARPKRQLQLALAVKQILARGIAGRVDFRGERLDVPVKVCVRAGDGVTVEKLSELAAALRQRHSGYRFPVQPHERITGLDCAFALDGIDLDVDDLDKRTASAVEQLVTLGSGLILSNLAVPIHIVETGSTGNDDNGESILTACRMNERLLGSAEGTEDDQSVLQSVKLKTRDGYNHAARLLTAVAESQRSTSVEIDINMVEAGMSTGTWLWEWLAYALFSSDASARSSITRVSLNNVFLTEIDAAAIAGVLRSTNPLNWVIHRNRRDSLNMGRLKRGTEIKLLPMRASENLPAEMPLYTLEHDIDGVKLLPDTEVSDHQRAVVPGYGICEVHRNQVIAVDTWRQSGAEVTSLKLQFEFSHEAVEGLGRFLPLVGRSLTHLEVFMHRALRVPLPVILRSCPQLKSLVLRDATINTAEFVHEYAYTTQQLEAIDCCITDLRPLANELADSKSGLASSMKRLDCRLVGPAHRLGGDQLQSIAAMLQANKTLEFVRLTIPRSIYKAEELEEVLKFHQEMLPVAREPFPLACRLALLSAFTSRADEIGLYEHERKRRAVDLPADGSKPSADLSRLPIIVHAFEKIFSFAAENVQRSVYVNCDGAWPTSFP